MNQYMNASVQFEYFRIPLEALDMAIILAPSGSNSN